MLESVEKEYNESYDYLTTVLESITFNQDSSEFEKAILELFKKYSDFYKKTLDDFNKNTINSIEYLQNEFGIKGKTPYLNYFIF